VVDDLTRVLCWPQAPASQPWHKLLAPLHLRRLQAPDLLAVAVGKWDNLPGASAAVPSWRIQALVDGNLHLLRSRLQSQVLWIRWLAAGPCYLRFGAAAVGAIVCGSSTALVVTLLYEYSQL
jgi:hypothetical protein